MTLNAVQDLQYELYDMSWIILSRSPGFSNLDDKMKVKVDCVSHVPFYTRA